MSICLVILDIQLSNEGRSACERRHAWCSLLAPQHCIQLANTRELLFVGHTLAHCLPALGRFLRLWVFSGCSWIERIAILLPDERSVAHGAHGDPLALWFATLHRAIDYALLLIRFGGKLRPKRQYCQRPAKRLDGRLVELNVSLERAVGPQNRTCKSPGIRLLFPFPVPVAGW